MPFKKQEDGTVMLKLKIKSQGQKKDGTTYFVNPPALYNQLGTRIEGTELAGLSVGNGSKIRAKIELSAWEFMGNSGVSCKPKSVQIAELVVFQGDGGGDLGFDALEIAKTDDIVDEEKGDFDF